MSARPVTKCICHDRSFVEIKKYAEENNVQILEELQSDKFCSCGCGLCGPYVELVLSTGETAFERGAYYRRNE